MKNLDQNQMSVLLFIYLFIYLSIQLIILYVT